MSTTIGCPIPGASQPTGRHGGCTGSIAKYEGEENEKTTVAA